MKIRDMSSLGCVVAVLVAGAMAAASPSAYNGFNSAEESPAFTLGELNGQGGTVDNWNGPWVTSTASLPGKYLVVTGGSPVTASSPGDPGQHLQMFGSTSGTYKAERAMDLWSGDFVFEFDAKYTGLPIATQQIQFEGTSSSLRPLNIKWEANGDFKMNDWVFLKFNTGIKTGDTTATFQSMVDNWVTVRIVADWDTATFDLYWTQTDGTMGLVGQKIGFKDAAFNGTTMTVQQMEIGAPKVATGTTNGLEIDRITLIPEPATLSLLALGGLAMMVRRWR